MTYQVPILIGGPHHGTAVTIPARCNSMTIPYSRARYVSPFEESVMPSPWPWRSDDRYVLKDYAIRGPMGLDVVQGFQMLVWEGCSDDEAGRLLWEFLIAVLDGVFGGQ